MAPLASSWQPGSTTALRDLCQQTIVQRPLFPVLRPVPAPLGGVPKARLEGVSVPKFDDESRAKCLKLAKRVVVAAEAEAGVNESGVDWDSD
eukprot:4207746-Amphidinium_carterae.1